MDIDLILPDIPELNQSAMQAAEKRQNTLTKPPGSLGQLEAISIRMAGITGQEQPILKEKAVITMAGDHGVVTEGVSAFPAEVTPQMVDNFLKGGAAINVLSQQIDARVVVVDMGVNFDFEDHPHLLKHKIAPGTQNIAQGPAMSREQARQAIQAGLSVLNAQADQGLDILATGDMGIGNTTPSAAIACAITGHPPEKIVGRGTGVDDEGLKRKISAVSRALEVNQPDPKDSLDILAKVGGFEIGGLTGVILGAAGQGIPVVIDGFISTAAAMLAVHFEPRVRDYLFSAHRSQERGHQIMLDWLELTPLLSLGLRLGEGTGAVLAISLIESACSILREMATFEEAGVSNKE